MPPFSCSFRSRKCRDDGLRRNDGSGSQSGEAGRSGAGGGGATMRADERQFYQQLGEAIRFVRAIKGYSLRELAKRSHISNAFISQIESGSAMSLYRYLSLADALHIKPMVLINKATAREGT